MADPTYVVSIRSALVYRERSFESAINADATKDKTLIHGCPEGATSCGRSPGRGIDSETSPEYQFYARSVSCAFGTRAFILPLQTGYSALVSYKKAIMKVRQQTP